MFLDFKRPLMSVICLIYDFSNSNFESCCDLMSFFPFFFFFCFNSTFHKCGAFLPPLYYHTILLSRLRKDRSNGFESFVVSVKTLHLVVVFYLNYCY